MERELQHRYDDQGPWFFETLGRHSGEPFDIHDRHQRVLRDLPRAESCFKEKGGSYRSFVQSIEDGYYEMDLDGRLAFFNEPFCKMLGYSAEQMVGMTCHDFMNEETAKRVDHTLKEVQATGKSAGLFDLQLFTIQGQKKCIDISVSLLFDTGGRVLGFRGLSREMTERKLMLDSLQATEERYRMILESVEDGYYEVDISGNMLFFNNSMSRILGYSAEELKGMNNRSFMSEKTAREVYETFNEVYRTGKPQKAFGWELIRKNGEGRHVETSVSLVRGQGGGPIGFRGIARDITELRALDVARKKVMNHLSHELSTPLAIISWALTRIPIELERGNLAKVDDLIRRGSRHVERLRDLQYKIADILGRKKVANENRAIIELIETSLSLIEETEDTFSQMGREALLRGVRTTLESFCRIEDLCWEDVHLDAFLEDVCRQAELKSTGRQVQIIREFEPGVSLRMDRKVLQKVCGGLLKNAIESTPDEGRVVVKSELENGILNLDFRDLGIGITPENQEMIFQGFFHTQDSEHYASKHPYFFNAGGTGLDLLRARVLAERLGFKIDFSSARCRYLPSDREECPGRISKCPFVKSQEDCFDSGGSLFRVRFPLELFVIEKGTDGGQPCSESPQPGFPS